MFGFIFSKSGSIIFDVIFFVVIWIGPLVGAAVTALHTQDFLRHAIVVPGQIVEAYCTGQGRSFSCYSKVEFVTKAGQQVSSTDAGSGPTLKAGDQVTVLYSANAPAQTATINQPSIVWKGPQVFLMIEGISIFGSVLIMLILVIQKARGRL